MRMQGLDEARLATALANPDLTRRELDRLDAEARLLDYIRLTWSILEPGRVFKEGWAICAICEHLEAVTKGQLKRLLINVPPGFMKSLQVNVFWPTWEWGPYNRPDLRYVHASYSPDLTIRDNRKARKLIKSPIYQDMWGDRFHIVEDQDAKTKFENNHAGFKLATSIGGVGTGERGDRGIIDDPHKVREAESDPKLEAAVLWFAEEWPSRINDPEESVQLCIMQRIRENDVSGAILASELEYHHLMIPMEFESDRRCYTVVYPSWWKEAGEREDEPTKVEWAKLPTGQTLTRQEYDEPWEMDESRQEALQAAERRDALKWFEGYLQDPRREENELAWKERFTRRHLEKELKPQMAMLGGTYAEAGQLQQRPAPRGGGMFKRKDFQVITMAEFALMKVSATCRGWDFAGSKKKGSAFTASCKVARAGKSFVVMHAKKARWSPGEVADNLRKTTVADGHGVVQDMPQDPGQAGLAQKAAFASLLAGYRFRFSTESGSKEDRARPAAGQTEAGNVYILKGPWNEEFLAEHEVFPRGRYKDLVDAFTRAFQNLVSIGYVDDEFAAPVVVDNGDVGGHFGALSVRPERGGLGEYDWSGEL